MSRVRLHRLGSLLGLLAILMLTLASTVSQELASHHPLGDALAMYCSSEGEGASATHDSKSLHSATGHGQVCPYCSLLAHATELPGSAVVFAAPPMAVPTAVAVASTLVHAILPYTGASARASCFIQTLVQLSLMNRCFAHPASGRLSRMRTTVSNDDWKNQHAYPHQAAGVACARHAPHNGSACSFRPHANGVCALGGWRPRFPATLTVDDPSVGDELDT
ncbi:MFS transporter [Caballeronia hypogeia]|uniref:MFS transporter n=1 Tax=Caballeronia hypogeia TaxID=1777140 RepID=A0A158DSN1_9BURK|nr:MFS transporter [Caballeronia hypogeia]